MDVTHIQVKASWYCRYLFTCYMNNRLICPWNIYLTSSCPLLTLYMIFILALVMYILKKRPHSVVWGGWGQSVTYTCGISVSLTKLVNYGFTRYSSSHWSTLQPNEFSLSFKCVININLREQLWVIKITTLDNMTGLHDDVM